MLSYLTHLECSNEGNIYSFRKKKPICRQCDSTLIAEDGLRQIKGSRPGDTSQHRSRGIWRRKELLPVQSKTNRASLGEGDTPVVRHEKTGRDLRLNIPNVFAEKLFLRIIKESHGSAIAIKDDEMEIARTALSNNEGMLFSLEGAAAYLSLSNLLAEGTIQPDQRIVIINTASGIKSL